MIVKSIYKVFRSIIFSLTLVVVGFYVLTYTLVSIPALTNYVKDRIANELSNFLEAEVSIDNLQIYPFNEVQINGLQVYDQSGNKCLDVATLGAGIRLWKLIWENKIELTYGEIIGLHAYVVQPEEDAPLNIDFIIKAFASDNQNKEKKPFDLAMHNVVLRKSSAVFQRPWIHGKHIGRLDLSNLEIDDLAADISFPHISDKEIVVDLRRLSMSIPDIAEVNKIRFNGYFSSDSISVENFTVELPGSRLFIPGIDVASHNGQNLISSLHKDDVSISIEDSYITPEDFQFLFETLKSIDTKLPLALRATGNLDHVTVEQFSFGNNSELFLTFAGDIKGLNDFRNSEYDLSNLELNINANLIDKFLPSISLPDPKLKYALSHVGNIYLKGNSHGSISQPSVECDLDLVTQSFSMMLDGSLEKISQDKFNIVGEVNFSKVMLNHLIPSVPLNNINANLVIDGFYKGKESEGVASIEVENLEFKGKKLNGLSIHLSKNSEEMAGDLIMNNAISDLNAHFSGDIFNDIKTASLDLDIERLNLSEILEQKKYQDYIITGKIKGSGSGSDLNDLTGNLALEKMSFTSPDKSKKLSLNQFVLRAEKSDSVRNMRISSDWMDADFSGELNPKVLFAKLQEMAATVSPSFVNADVASHVPPASNLDFKISIKANNAVTEFFNLPVRLLVPVEITGNVEALDNTASVIIDVPYLQQGKDKLIYDSFVKLNLDGNIGELVAVVETTFPVKKGDLKVSLNVYAHDDALSTDIDWINTENSDFKGRLVLDSEIEKDVFTHLPIVRMNIKPSTLQMGVSDWHLSPASISYYDKSLTVDGLKIYHDNQFVEIAGVASPEYADALRISLEEIDVDYVFDMLRINYVTFGGTATGEVAGRALLSSDPVAETESFKIKDLSYNGSIVGDCLVTSKWNNEEKEIEIGADISRDGKRCVIASGGIWLGRDSLCFDINATKVNVGFVQPFMSVFSSHVGGFASGDVKLFGTFHDIDMTGRIFADSVAVKLDYTNTIYHGSDSVILDPGRIIIPNFKLYDKFDNSALLTGELTHNYFHDPSFTFRLSDARDFLCYDTSSEINPDWYGTIFGNGSALVRGVPGIVDISADMTISDKTTFTFVLNDTQYAQDFQFLTFSDKKGEEEKRKKNALSVDDFKEMFKKKMENQENSLSKFGIDIRATVTPQALFILVMDPRAGDKITARGRGAMQIKYESDNDEMTMYGKYEIDEGSYNFSLQDIILRDFKIKEGSSISFNGNPLAADLDIRATYRVNTNLSDLDKSFSTDRDLNRTNVPVDAVLSVNGNMQQPDITFDIELPTLTQDVERKVKSIISTDDMMNRQIIYLLALNRFYTPEYMGMSGNGGELAAVASSTISSQLSNILGQLTDKLSVSPSIRSDKGDFSDIEVDVALSSRLLNNRLLINGNFGYRDRSNSSTTFVGDFDVEYLLSKNGNLRLKAYNHFNDQNYYLREALTTQGLGIVYRRDFDDWFTFLKKRKKKQEAEENIEKEETETEMQQPSSESASDILKNGTDN